MFTFWFIIPHRTIFQTVSLEFRIRILIHTPITHTLCHCSTLDQLMLEKFIIHNLCNNTTCKILSHGLLNLYKDHIEAVFSVQTCYTPRHQIERIKSWVIKRCCFLLVFEVYTPVVEQGTSNVYFQVVDGVWQVFAIDVGDWHLEWDVVLIIEDFYGY